MPEQNLALKAHRYDDGFMVSHSSENYRRHILPLSQAFSNNGTVIYWRLGLDAGDDNTITIYRNAIERGIIKNGAPEEHAHSFSQAVGEGLENIIKHNYRFAPGNVVEIHARLNPIYDVASISGEGIAPKFEIIEAAMADAIEYNRKVRALNEGRLLAKSEGRLPSEEEMKEILDLMRGNHGKGIKDMVGRCDYLRCEYHDKRTIWMLLMIRPQAIGMVH